MTDELVFVSRDPVGSHEIACQPLRLVQGRVGLYRFPTTARCARVFGLYNSSSHECTATVRYSSDGEYAMLLPPNAYVLLLPRATPYSIAFHPFCWCYALYK